jgi:hypothetical protein
MHLRHWVRDAGCSSSSRRIDPTTVFVRETDRERDRQREGGVLTISKCVCVCVRERERERAREQCVHATWSV